MLILIPTQSFLLSVFLLSIYLLRPKEEEGVAPHT